MILILSNILFRFYIFNFNENAIIFICKLERIYSKIRQPFYNTAISVLIVLRLFKYYNSFKKTQIGDIIVNLIKLIIR